MCSANLFIPLGATSFLLQPGELASYFVKTIFRLVMYFPASN
jgi:hypothetical protein